MHAATRRLQRERFELGIHRPRSELMRYNTLPGRLQLDWPGGLGIRIVPDPKRLRMRNAWVADAPLSCSSSPAWPQANAPSRLHQPSASSTATARPCRIPACSLEISLQPNMGMLQCLVVPRSHRQLPCRLPRPWWRGLSQRGLQRVRQQAEHKGRALLRRGAMPRAVLTLLMTL